VFIALLIQDVLVPLSVLLIRAVLVPLSVLNAVCVAVRVGAAACAGGEEGS
jgi:hypothetical protein